ncbi:4Fe-4S binding protein [Marinobacter hydrocarbonoclasticus]|uniref:4Fe-4S binding protein n=1 Tax=Marinobacter nauticus TaxID=2743 RepID=UPI001C954575|nr:4Fe-4S binding protein [Marinobacter nauticus]MBY6192409.1 4Fe-4S binding protein [Marinobacter nauticus]MBY6213557.1 4Fe-4S binding protein [Marinobacter nauticus]
MHAQTVNPKDTLQQKRLITRSAFFLLFLLAPVLNIFRYDLTETRFILLGFPLSFNLNLDWVAQSTPAEVAGQILFWFVLPILVLVPLVLWIAFRWGRLYCGWLCPHFSVVETINDLMTRITGRPTLWEALKKGSTGKAIHWAGLTLVCALIGFSWALALLSYLLPPMPLYTDLVTGQLGLYPGIFLAVATAVFTFDFLFARHLFCKYGCAVGLVQSIAWMTNGKGRVVTFDTKRAAACRDCTKACDEACPMRLPTRSHKRAKFSCTQCLQCVSACREVQKDNPEGSLLTWEPGEPGKHTVLIPVRQVESTPRHSRA